MKSLLNLRKNRLFLSKLWYNDDRHYTARMGIMNENMIDHVRRRVERREINGSTCYVTRRCG